MPDWLVTRKTNSPASLSASHRFARAVDPAEPRNRADIARHRGSARRRGREMRRPATAPGISRRARARSPAHADIDEIAIEDDAAQPAVGGQAREQIGSSDAGGARQSTTSRRSAQTPPLTRPGRRCPRAPRTSAMRSPASAPRRSATRVVTRRSASTPSASGASASAAVSARRLMSNQQLPFSSRKHASSRSRACRSAPPVPAGSRTIATSISSSKRAAQPVSRPRIPRNARPRAGQQHDPPEAVPAQLEQQRVEKRRAADRQQRYRQSAVSGPAASHAPPHRHDGLLDHGGSRRRRRRRSVKPERRLAAHGAGRDFRGQRASRR